MSMIVEFSTIFKTKINDSPELQLDFLLCQMLRKTPGEIMDLEAQGLLTFEQKVFLQAGIIWSLEQGMGMCPWR